ncbi:MAG: hypothetical protein C0517_12280 [Erythrobacter sp.]|nr:hypothetical protein [Erythrobacter sp.]
MVAWPALINVPSAGRTDIGGWPSNVSDTARGDAPLTGGAGATVTVAIACYNQGRFLADAIASILGQHRPADAIILVDDGSTDDTNAVALAHPGVAYLQQPNAGLSAARNAALAVARTSHILFLDADDRLWPGALAHALACFAARPDIAFAYGGYRNVALDLTPIAVCPPVSKPDAFVAMLHDNFIGMHGTVLYDVAKLRGIGGFDTRLPSCEDYDVYLKLARHHPIACYPHIGADYRRHGASMSASAARMSRIARQVLKRQIDSGLTAEQQTAARAGLAFNRRHYSYQLIGMIRRQPTALPRLVWAGLREDRCFAFRLIRAAASALRRLPR